MAVPVPVLRGRCVKSSASCVGCHYLEPDGALTKEHEVPCLVAPDASAHTASLTENMRSQVPPA